jgi:hypothetical protein
MTYWTQVGGLPAAELGATIIGGASRGAGREQGARSDTLRAAALTCRGGLRAGAEVKAVVRESAACHNRWRAGWLAGGNGC